MNRRTELVTGDQFGPNRTKYEPHEMP